MTIIHGSHSAGEVRPDRWYELVSLAGIRVQIEKATQQLSPIHYLVIRCPSSLTPLHCFFSGFWKVSEAGSILHDRTLQTPPPIAASLRWGASNSAALQTIIMTAPP